MYETIGGGYDEIDLNGRSVNARAYCSWYNFKSADQQKKVGVLSGMRLPLVCQDVQLVGRQRATFSDAPDADLRQEASLPLPLRMMASQNGG